MTIPIYTCFGNWPSGYTLSSGIGTITGLTSGTIWNAAYGVFGNINFTLSVDPLFQTSSYFYKVSTSTSNFILGEQVTFSGFGINGWGKSINGTYYITNLVLNGTDLYHEVRCNPLTTTTTTTTSTTVQPTLQRQELSAFLKLFYSGGLNNKNPSLSLGGEISNYNVKTGKNNIFENIKGETYSEGLTDFRCVYVKNTSQNKVFYLYFSLDDFFLGSIMDLGFNFVNEIQTITILNGPFTNGQNIIFSYKNQNITVTYNTNFSVWLANFNIEIIKIPELENVVVTGSSNGSNSIFEITFQGSAGYKNHPLLVLEGYTLSPTPNVTILKSVQGGPINTVADKILTSKREPTNITFYDAPITSPVYLPALFPDDFMPIWLRRIIYPNTIAIENDGCNLIVSGNYEVIET